MVFLATISPLSATRTTDVDPTKNGSSSSSSSSYERKCQEWGFDVYQLSCDTCDLIPPSHKSHCQTCCQSWKTLDTRTERYGYAILVEGSYLSEQLQEFVKEDIQHVQQMTTDKFTVLPHNPHTKPSGGGGGGLGLMGGGFQQMMGGSSSQLYFFESQPSNSQDESIFASHAKKTIDLQAWKRDDVRDMVITLLTK